MAVPVVNFENATLAQVITNQYQASHGVTFSSTDDTLAIWKYGNSTADHHYGGPNGDNTTTDHSSGHPSVGTYFLGTAQCSGRQNFTITYSALVSQAFGNILDLEGTETANFYAYGINNNLLASFTKTGGANGSVQSWSFTRSTADIAYVKIDASWVALDNISGSDPAVLSASNTNFGNVRVGTSSTATVTVTNTGSSGSTLTGSIGSASGAEFSPTTGAENFSLGSNQSFNRTYTYAPSSRGNDSTNVSVTSNAGSSSRTLTGTGVSPVFSSSIAVGSTIDFGEVGYIANQTLRVQNLTPDANLGNLTDMTLLSATITGPDASYFTIENFTPGMKLSKSELQDLSIKFMHNYSGREDYGYVRNATLNITTDVGADFGSQGASYAFNLQAVTIPEPGCVYLLGVFLSLMLIFKKRISF